MYETTEIYLCMLVWAHGKGGTAELPGQTAYESPSIIRGLASISAKE